MDAKQSDKKLLGRRIKELRAKRGYSQEALAERMGINAKYLGSIEVGNENPTLELLINCAKAMDVELLDLFNFTWLTLRERQLRDKVKQLAERGDIDQLKEVFVLMRSRDL